MKGTRKKNQRPRAQTKETKGWVYVVSDPSNPQLSKIGYSSKDPKVRLKDFNNAGRAHDCQLEYAVLLTDPHDAEQQIHRMLKDSWRNLHENKEWFRLDRDKAIEVVRWFVGDDFFSRSPRGRPIGIVQSALHIRAATKIIAAGRLLLSNAPNADKNFAFQLIEQD